MKLLRVTCCLFVLLLSLLGFAFLTSAHAAASGSATVFTFHGLSAIAFFDNTSGCIETFVFVDGTQSLTGSKSDVTIGQVDNCTDTTLLAAMGSTSNPDFQVAASLASASLSATVSVFDGVSGNTFNVSVSQTWTATGPRSPEHEDIHFASKNFTETFHLNGTFRDASASGTVSDGTTNFTPSPSVFAQIASFDSGDVEITHA